MSKFVQVEQKALLQYVDYVTRLSKDHTKLQEQMKDAKDLAGIVEQTYKSRLDRLTDLILDIHPANYKYEQGLMHAFNIVAGHE